jgi:hypothetical protein
VAERGRARTGGYDRNGSPSLRFEAFDPEATAFDAGGSWCRSPPAAESCSRVPA